MDTQPKIPTLKDSQKPQVKIRGLEAGATLFDRLKQFKKKDLAFILAGLGTLFMAPLAEHFMMSPEAGDAALQPGWKGGAGNGGPFNSGSSNIPEGGSGFAPGSPTGGGSDIITPLNVRDPSNLVMGPGATPQPPTGSALPATPPPTAPTKQSESDLKDALAASARGASAGAKAAAKTLLPVPKIALSGAGGLRGLGVASGASSASAGLSAPSSNGLAPSHATTGGGMTNVKAPSNYAGVARGQTNGGHGGLDALKAAAGDAAANFNRGPASTALDQSAAANLPGGGSSFGGNGAGGMAATDKAGGGNSTKDSKNVGESLAFLKQKAIQEAQIALWAKEQEAGDNKLEALKIRNQMAESITGAIASSVGQGIGACITNGFSGCMGVGGAPVLCNQVVGGQMGPPTSVPSSQIVPSMGACKNGGAQASGITVYPCGSSYCSCSSPGQELYKNCSNGGGAGSGGDDKPKPPHGAANAGTGVAGDMSSPPVADLGSACQNLETFKGTLNGLKPTPAVTSAKSNLDLLLIQAKQVVAIRDDIGSSSAKGGGIPSSGDCKATSGDLKLTGKDTVLVQLNNIAGSGGVLRLKDTGILDRMDAAASSKDSSKPDLNQLATDATDPQKGAAASIDTFVGDVKIVHDANAALDKNLLNTPDPLKLDAIQAEISNQVRGKSAVTQVTSDAKTAVDTIQKAAQTTGLLVGKLDLAANTDLKDQSGVLKGTAGKDGTVSKLVDANNSADKIGGAPEMKNVKDPLKAPDLSKGQDGDSKGATKVEDMNKNLTQAKKDIKAADDQVQTTFPPEYAKGQAAKPKDDQCATVCKDAKDAAQKALDTAGKDVRGIRADQKAIDGSVRDAATTAAGRVGL